MDRTDQKIDVWLTQSGSPDVHGWQPIETAPKDGSDILMFSARNGRRVARYEPWRLSPKAEWFVAMQPGCSGGTYMTHPTRWMPLPEPPADVPRKPKEMRNG